jgi:hypothetical protein
MSDFQLNGRVCAEQVSMSLSTEARFEREKLSFEDKTDYVRINNISASCMASYWTSYTASGRHRMCHRVQQIHDKEEIV